MGNECCIGIFVLFAGSIVRVAKRYAWDGEVAASVMFRYACSLFRE